MKKYSIMIFVILIILILGGFANAETTVNNKFEGVEKIEEALPEEAGEILENISPNDSNAGEKGIDAIIEQIKNSKNIFNRAVSSAAVLLVIVLVSSIETSALEDGGVKDAVMLIVVIALAAASIQNADSYINMGIETLNSLSDFSKVLLPTMCSASAGSGAITSAGAKYAATALFMDILMTVGIKVIIPLIMLYLASVIAGAAFGRDMLGNISKLLKWLCTTSLTLLVAAFTAYLSVSGIITAKSDEMASKITKTALGTLLPIVGDTVSSAAETIIAGAGILRNSIGVFGMIGVAAICIAPFLSLGAYYLTFKGAAALSLAVSDRRISDLIDGVGSTFGMILALIGAAGIMLFISLVSSMKAVTG